MNEHWGYFAEFVRDERAVGGPDPHMVLVGKMSEGEAWEERVWRAGCYVGVYNVPTAEALWLSWPWASARTADTATLERWLREHWGGIATRRERRCVRRPEQLARYLATYAAWVRDVSPTLRRQSYEQLWESAQRGVYALGRYGTMKLLECYVRYCDVYTAVMPDIRARGGASPREALCLLFPDQARQIGGGDASENIALAEAAGQHVRQYLREEHGLALDNYLTQVLLCDYKQSYVGHRQYPGRSHDSELQYAATVAAHFGADTEMFTARATLFPARALGERGGWAGVRGELGTVLATYGYTWSDLRYDYLSTANLGAPVRWA